MCVPIHPKIYHIVHVDNLASIIASNGLFSDYMMTHHPPAATGTGPVRTIIGMAPIKARRLNELFLSSHPDLTVGQCVPFYFCPRSVMLYMIHRRSHELSYKGGQAPIVHLESDMQATITWAQANNRRWAFTQTNAGAYYCQHYSSLDELEKIDWKAVQSRNWTGAAKKGKQAEFLIEETFPWTLVDRIGIYSQAVMSRITTAMHGAVHRPRVEIMNDWYY